MEKQKIQFSDLTWQLKMAVICAYIVAGIWLLAFLVGFISAGVIE